MGWNPMTGLYVATQPIDTRPLPPTQAKNQKSSQAALNVEDSTRMTTAWGPESFKQLLLDSVANVILPKRRRPR